MSVFSRTQPVQEAPAPPPPPEPTAEELRRAEIAREGARPARERVREMVAKREAEEAAQRQHVAESERRRAREDYERRQHNLELRARAQRAWAARRSELQGKVAALRSELSQSQSQADAFYARGDLTGAAQASALVPVIQRALAQAESELAAHIGSQPAFRGR